MCSINRYTPGQPVRSIIRNSRGGPPRVEASLMQALVRFNDVVLKAGRVLAWVLLSLMTAIVLYQVFFRYVLNDAPSWSEAASRALMVWMTFLVAPSAYRWGAYVNIDVAVHSLPPRPRRVLSLFLNVVAVVLILILFWLSLDFVDRGFTRRAAGLPAAVLGVPIKAAWTRIAMPIGFAMMVLVGIELVLRDITRILHPERAEEPVRAPDFMRMD